MALPQEVEREFIDGLNTGDKRGLWVFGPRQSGTSTAIKTLYDNNKEAFPDVGAKRRAAALERDIRELWRLNKLLDANLTDHALWSETNEQEKKVEKFWNADALWLDDLYPEMDKTFFRKNILLRLDELLKCKRIVLVSGNCRPDAFGEEWHRAITGQFHVFENTSGTG